MFTSMKIITNLKGSKHHWVSENNSTGESSERLHCNCAPPELLLGEAGEVSNEVILPPASACLSFNPRLQTDPQVKVLLS